MKILFTLAALAALSTVSMGQFVSTRWDKKPAVDPTHPRSIITSFDYNRLDVGYLQDGAHDSYAGVYTPVGVFNTLGVDFGPLVGTRHGATEQTNLGLFFTKPVYNHANVLVRVGAGFNGFDLTSGFNFQDGNKLGSLGLFITIKN